MSFNQISEYQADDFVMSHIYMKKSSDYPLHSHDVCEMIFLKRGDISYIVEGKDYRLGKNCLFISRPTEMHAIKFHDNREYERYNILFDERKLPTDIYNRIPPGISFINFEGNTLISDLFKKMDYYCENFEGNILENLLLHLTEEVLCNVLLASKELKQDSVYTVNPMINKALEHIEANLTASLSIDSICNELYITKSHLHHLFVKHLGTSPKKYIVSKKMLLAQRELHTGAKPTDVCLNCGFSDYSTFFRDYKKYFGHAPSEETSVKVIRTIQS